MSPMQLSLAYLRASGFIVDITERWVPVEKMMPASDDSLVSAAAKRAGGYKRDLFGFVDILAIRRSVVLAVQTSTVGNIAARVHKIQCLAEFEWCKRAGMQIHVHGWAGAKKSDGFKVVDMTTMETLWSSIVLRGRRSKSRPRHQVELKL